MVSFQVTMLRHELFAIISSSDVVYPQQQPVIRDVTWHGLTQTNIVGFKEGTPGRDAGNDGKGIGKRNGKGR